MKKVSRMVVFFLGNVLFFPCYVVLFPPFSLVNYNVEYSFVVRRPERCSKTRMKLCLQGMHIIRPRSVDRVAPKKEKLSDVVRSFPRCLFCGGQ